MWNKNDLEQAGLALTLRGNIDRGPRPYHARSIPDPAKRGQGLDHLVKVPLRPDLAEVEREAKEDGGRFTWLGCPIPHTPLPPPPEWHHRRW